MEKFFAWVVTGGTGVNGLREKRTVLLVQFRVLASRIGSKSCSCSHWLIQKNVLSDGFCSHCKRAVRAVTNSDFWAHTAPLFSKLKILDIFQINTLDIAKFMFRYHNNLLPPLFLNLFMTNSQVHRYDTRTAGNYRVHSCRTNIKKFTILYQGPRVWNCLPSSITNLSSFPTLKNKVPEFLLK